MRYIYFDHRSATIRCAQLRIDTDLFLTIFNLGKYKYAAAKDTPINNSKKFPKSKWRATIDRYPGTFLNS